MSKDIDERLGGWIMTQRAQEDFAVLSPDGTARDTGLLSADGRPLWAHRMSTEHGGICASCASGIMQHEDRVFMLERMDEEDGKPVFKEYGGPFCCLACGMNDAIRKGCDCEN